MLTTILTVGFIGIIIGTSTHHEPHHGHHDHRTHVQVVQTAPPPVVHRHNKKVVVVKSKPAQKKVLRKRPVRKHRKR